MSEASKKFQRENAHQFYLGNPPVAGHAELVADPEYQKLAVDEKAMETKYAELLKAFVGKTDPQLTMDERNVVGNINHLCEMERKALRTKLYNLKVDYGIDPDTQKRAPDTGTLLSPSTTGIFLDSVDLKILRALAVDPRRTMTQTQLEQY